MSPLQERLAELRARVRQLLWLYGVSWLTVVLLGALLLVGLLDWWLHLDDAGVRLILALGILGSSGYVAYRRLIAPLRVPMSDIDLALRIEQRFPKFRDSLASTIQFLESNQDASLGAPAMQKRVIDRTLKQAKSIDFEDVLQSQPVQRVAWMALLTCLIVAVVVGFNRVEAATALKRLVFPFRSNPWPRQTQLQFVDEQLQPLVHDAREPLRIARGDTLELTIINLNQQKRLPSNVQLEIRHPDGSVTREAVQRKSLRIGAAEPREAVFASLVIKAPFQFRATGGDDQDMEWLMLEVVPPPVTETLQVRLVPPKYSRRPAVKLPAGVGHVEGLIGTRVEITAKANKPLSEAVLRIRDKDQKPVTIGPDRMKLTAAFVIKEAGIYSYWLDLRDRQKFGNSDAPRYEIRATQDAVPDIYIDKPAIDTQVTPTADVSLKIVAKDDLGLQQIRMQYQILEPGKTELSKPVVIPLITLDKRPLQHTHEYVWPLEPLKLVAGMQIQLHAEATDDFDLGTPHVGRSLTRTLTIVSPDEKTLELATRQFGLLNEMERAKKQETEIAAQTAELKTQLEKAGALRPQDLDLLQRIEGQQRQLATTLQNPQDGMLTRSQEILREFKQNRIDAPETERRLQQISSELQRLIDQHLPEIEQNLTQARKDAGDSSRDAKPTSPRQESSKSPPPASPDQNPSGADSPRDKSDKTEGSRPNESSPDNKPGETKAADAKPDEISRAERTVTPPRAGASPAEQALHQAQQHQQAVSETLGDLLQELSQWQDERQAAMAVQEIRQAQEKINQETAELGQQTVSKLLQDLKGQQQADLARQTERQKHEADELEQLQRKLGDVIEKMQTEDPSSAGRLQDALEQLQNNTTVAKMRASANLIGENKIGEAAQTQQKVASDLQAVEDALKNRPTSDLETLVKQLQQTEQELQEVLEKQEELLKKTKEAQQQADPQQKSEQIEQLKQDQAALKKKAEQLSRKLQRLQLKTASEAAKRAADRMQQAGEELDDEGIHSEKEEQEALDDLEQAQREVAKEREEAQERLAFEQLEKVADQIRTVAERQQAVLDETKRLNEAHVARGNWTRPQLKSLIDLAVNQRSVQSDAASLAEKLSAAEVFRLAVKGAARQMGQAAQRLDSRETDATTQRYEESALQRFKDLMEALKEEKPEKPDQEEQPAGNNGEQQQQSSGPQMDRVAMLSQLKMLRSMQVDLNTRVLELATKRDAGNPLNTAELEELKALSQEQGELADLAEKLMQAFNPTTEQPPTIEPTEETEQKPDVQPKEDK